MGELVLGIVIAILIGIGSSATRNYYKTEIETYQKVIQECEKTLPRNQNCKVIAVVNQPEGEDNDSANHSK